MLERAVVPPTIRSVWLRIWWILTGLATPFHSQFTPCPMATVADHIHIGGGQEYHVDRTNKLNLVSSNDSGKYAGFHCAMADGERFNRPMLNGCQAHCAVISALATRTLREEKDPDEMVVLPPALPHHERVSPYHGKQTRHSNVVEDRDNNGPCAVKCRAVTSAQDSCQECVGKPKCSLQ
jgi:hypothetical protein